MLRDIRVFHEMGVSSPSLYIFRCQLEKLNEFLENSKLGITRVLRHLGLYSWSLQALIMSEMFTPVHRNAPQIAFERKIIKAVDGPLSHTCRFRLEYFMVKT
jgi:hypothetical protein